MNANLFSRVLVLGIIVVLAEIYESFSVRVKLEVLRYEESAYELALTGVSCAFVQ